METMSQEAAQGAGCGRILFVLLLILTPIYLYFRYFMKVVRAYYGFSDAKDEGPPIRVCPSCHNTVLETDFSHCPYCGLELPPESVVGAPADEGGAERDSGSPVDAAAGAGAQGHPSAGAAKPVEPPRGGRSDGRA